MTDVALELVKAIHDEYGLILATEHSNLQKALAIGQKLVALRPLAGSQLLFIEPRNDLPLP